MSEITTGAVALSSIGAPLAIGAACLTASYFAVKFGMSQYEKMLNELESTDARLKWLDNNLMSSPMTIANTARELKSTVINNPLFISKTKGLSLGQKEVLAGVIVTQNSPLKAYVPKLLGEEGLTNDPKGFDTALKTGTKNLALDNLCFVNKVVKEAANATGFSTNMSVLKESKSLMDIVFTDNLGRKFTAYCKLDKQLNPSLALDLEGFGCEGEECTRKMDEIVVYLQQNGVPFYYKRTKHNQPMGLLRQLLSKQQEMTNYLQGNNQFNNNQQKQ